MTLLDRRRYDRRNNPFLSDAGPDPEAFAMTLTDGTEDPGPLLRPLADTPPDPAPVLPAASGAPADPEPLLPPADAPPDFGPLLRPLSDRGEPPPVMEEITITGNPRADIDELRRAMASEGASEFLAHPEAVAGIGAVALNRIGAAGFRPNATLHDLLHADKQFQGVGNDTWEKFGNPESLTGPNAKVNPGLHDTASQLYYFQRPDPTGGATFFYTGKPDAPPTAEMHRRLNGGGYEAVYLDPFTFLRPIK